MQKRRVTVGLVTRLLFRQHRVIPAKATDVIPAQAGIPQGWSLFVGVPASAGMTRFPLETYIWGNYY